MPRQYFLCDLRDDAAAQSAYRRYHAAGAVWPEVLRSIRGAGITGLEIHLAGNRLLMVMETDASYDAAARAERDAADPVVQRWENLMDTFQQRLPFATDGEKWVPMERIFDLHEQP
ncbi:L-rhamnose mutarotase [Lewinella sp. IMCC34183]|uniref:L-rhamnose mutarotase n=1 Tax=Lewinella sp. IMCC34183 TaxID=2248762 RepID=UPI000E22D7CF|nr:L-rhamnose mutarotase [Lewinella sp. IMCC34183]